MTANLPAPSMRRGPLAAPNAWPDHPRTPAGGRAGGRSPAGLALLPNRTQQPQNAHPRSGGGYPPTAFALQPNRTQQSGLGVSHGVAEQRRASGYPPAAGCGSSTVAPAGAAGRVVTVAAV